MEAGSRRLDSFRPLVVPAGGGHQRHTRQPLGPLGAKLNDGLLEELVVVQELVDGVDAMAADGG